MSSELECALRDKVLIDLAKGLTFRAAFAQAAHQHRIFHSDLAKRATYNYLFRAVEGLLKRALGTNQTQWHANAQARVGKKTPSSPSETTSPARRPAFTGQMAAAGERPEDYD